MKVEFLQVPAREVREGVVQFLWHQKHWPGPTIEHYYRMWDWRYSSLSDGDAIVYVARATDTGAIVGHVAVYPRRFRYGSTEINVGVPGNLVIHDDFRENFVGPRMCCFPKSQARDGRFDLILAFANTAAHAAFMRLGFHDIGYLHTYLDVHATGAVLRRRMKAAAAAGPVLDLAISMRRRIYQRNSLRASTFDVREVTAEDFVLLNTSHWKHRDGLIISDDSPRYVSTRFLTCPYMPRTMYGLFDRNKDILEGYVIVEGSERAKVWNCEVNHAVLSEPAAISLVAKSVDEIDTIYVPTLPASPLAQQLVRGGFVARDPEDYIEKHTRICAYWRPDHPLADIFADQRRWQLWFGNNHY